MRRSKPTIRRGFTLMELMVASVIAAVIGAALMGVMGHANRTVVRSGEVMTDNRRARAVGMILGSAVRDAAWIRPSERERRELADVDMEDTLKMLFTQSTKYMAHFRSDEHRMSFPLRRPLFDSEGEGRLHWITIEAVSAEDGLRRLVARDTPFVSGLANPDDLEELPEWMGESEEYLLFEDIDDVTFEYERPSLNNAVLKLGDESSEWETSDRPVSMSLPGVVRMTVTFPRNAEAEERSYTWCPGATYRPYMRETD